MTESSKPQLLRAKAAIKDIGGEGGGSGSSSQWRTDLSFDELRTALGRSFAGIPGKADGEPTFSWCFDQCHDHDLKAETMKFMLSYPISETLAGRRRYKYMDLSCTTPDGAIASTVVVVESEGKKKGVLDKVGGGFREFLLTLSLWRKDGIPKLFTDREWKEVDRNVEGRIDQLIKNMPIWHAEYGPKGLHWYVQFVGTNPDCGAQGYGAKVMMKLAELADREKVDCYLECDYEKNRGFYAKYGFEEVAKKELVDPSNPADVRAVCLMIRRHRLRHEKSTGSFTMTPLAKASFVRPRMYPFVAATCCIYYVAVLHNTTLQTMYSVSTVANRFR